MRVLFKQSLVMILWMTLLTGILYPLALTQIAQMLMRETANGSLLLSKEDNKILGSQLIGQKFVQDKYFWPRPSAIDYNPMPSGGSNLGPTSAELKKNITENFRRLTGEETPNPNAFPFLLLFNSASGIDPDIIISAALIQVDRVAKARGMDTDEGKKKIVELIYDAKVKKTLNLFGRDCINVLVLNLALDNLESPKP